MSRADENFDKKYSLLEATVKEANTGIAIYEIKNENPLRLTFFMASKGFLSITGYEEAELLLKAHGLFGELYSESSASIFTALITENSGQNDLQVELTRKCGDVLHVQASAQKVMCAYGSFLVKTITDISELQNMQRKILKKNEQLLEENEKLERQGDAAVNVIESMAEERKKSQARIYTSIVQLLEPAIHNLKFNNFSKKDMVTLLESITLSLSGLGSEKIQSALKVLSAKELEMAHLIRQGYASKEIATFMNVGHQTVSSYRKNVRKKLGIQNASVNLREYLVDLFQKSDSIDG
ncbi:MAG: LuxR C-terminal-related transcriptional regulator [Fibrobacterales bacterium]